MNQPSHSPPARRWPHRASWPRSAHLSRTTTTQCSRALQKPRAEARRPLPYAWRRRPHAGRGGARSRGGRPGARPSGDDGDQSRLRRLREVVRPLATRLRAELVEVEVPYNESVDPGELERAFREHPGATLVAFVHSETPSGTLNPAPGARAGGEGARRSSSRTSRRSDARSSGRTTGASTSASPARRSVSPARRACR